MTLEVDHEPLDPVTNNPSLDGEIHRRLGKQAPAGLRGDRKQEPLMQKALLIPEEEG